MSRHYRRFLTELHAEWPAKKDGFDLAGLQKLRGAERDGARDLLRAAVMRGDSTAVEALAVLDQAEGLAFLRAQLHPGADELVQARILGILIAVGSDPLIEQAALALASSRSSVVRGDALRALEHFPITEQRRGMYIHALRTDPPNRLTASSVLLRLLGRKLGDGKTPDITAASRALTSNADEVREDMLRQLGLGSPGR